jgi:maleate isomerase
MKLGFDLDDGTGTRAVLGTIMLEADETMEPEITRITDLAGVAFYHNRIEMVPHVRPETLARMEAVLPATVRMFPASVGKGVIGYGCTSAATMIGLGR